ncbi:hypothetical protein FDP41_005598 [Naegleria fowleri]|uniref:Acetyl-CoA acetyltransferase n=1 Tax=Naegleria fowleri TaxID=5763 RepID=A0A6A5BNE7_NAEFO|nr:uncharacterized protein FDP41_005598 [Naegleria fowleri]KAF0975604.1 hypothetical protein FDP41_005598 [Naegleria fowleri]
MTHKTRAVIVAAQRTPIGSFLGKLSGFDAPKLGSLAIRSATQKAGVALSEVQEVIMGNVVSANLGQAPARQASIHAGLPESVVCTTVNKMCASGMKAVMYGTQNIELGIHNCVVAGGFESMSNAPYYIPQGRSGYRLGDGKLVDSILKDGLTDAYNGEHMEFTNINMDKVPQLKPAFVKENGTVTAANSSKLSDGGAALILMSEEKAKKAGIRPIARILGYGDAEKAPIDFTTAPSSAIPVALKHAGVLQSDVNLWEINEAFSAVALVNMRLLGLDVSNVNIFGGAVALGHPIGCSGARILCTLISALKHRKQQVGCAAICNGGGGASSVVIELL